MVDPYRHKAWRAEARAQKAESRGGIPDRRPQVFEHSRHSFWLLRHLNSVWRLQHPSTIYTKQGQMQMTKWPQRTTLFFFSKRAFRKILKYKLCRHGRRCWISIVRYRSVIRGSASQIRGAGSEIWRDPPPQFNLWWHHYGFRSMAVKFNRLSWFT